MPAAGKVTIGLALHWLSIEHHRLQWFIRIQAHSLRKGDEHPACCPVRITVDFACTVLVGGCNIGGGVSAGARPEWSDRRHWPGGLHGGAGSDGPVHSPTARRHRRPTVPGMILPAYTQCTGFETNSTWYVPASMRFTCFETNSTWYDLASIRSTFFETSGTSYDPASIHSTAFETSNTWYDPMMLSGVYWRTWNNWTRLTIFPHCSFGDLKQFSGIPVHALYVQRTVWVQPKSSLLPAGLQPLRTLCFKSIFNWTKPKNVNWQHVCISDVRLPLCSWHEMVLMCLASVCWLLICCLV